MASNVKMLLAGAAVLVIAGGAYAALFGNKSASGEAGDAQRRSDSIDPAN